LSETANTDTATPAAALTERVAEWYAQETGLDSLNGARRVHKIAIYLKRHDLGIDDVRLVTVTDPLWATRSNRSQTEKLGQQIGRTVNKGRPCYWFVVPLAAPIAEDELYAAGYAAAHAGNLDAPPPDVQLAGPNAEQRWLDGYRDFVAEQGGAE
jgi:hypothetical protein